VIRKLALVAALLSTNILTPSGSSWAAETAPDRHAAGVKDSEGRTSDFNGDGFADLAVGVPYEDRRIGVQRRSRSRPVCPHQPLLTS
jgi:hypothetical protein